MKGKKILKQFLGYAAYAATCFVVLTGVEIAIDQANKALSKKFGKKTEEPVIDDTPLTATIKSEMLYRQENVNKLLELETGVRRGILMYDDLLEGLDEIKELQTWGYHITDLDDYIGSIVRDCEKGDNESAARTLRMLAEMFVHLNIEYSPYDDDSDLKEIFDDDDD